MKQVCKVNKSDLYQVVEGLAVDMTDVIETGVVPEGAYDVDYNEIEDVHSVGKRVDNVFSAVDVQKSVSSALQSAPSDVPTSE